MVLFKVSSALFRGLLHKNNIRSFSSSIEFWDIYCCLLLFLLESFWNFLDLYSFVDAAEALNRRTTDSMMNEMFTLDISSQIGSCMPLSMMRIGTLIHNIELRPGQGGKMVRSAGTVAKILTEPSAPGAR